MKKESQKIFQMPSEDISTTIKPKVYKGTSYLLNATILHQLIVNHLQENPAQTYEDSKSYFEYFYSNTLHKDPLYEMYKAKKNGAKGQLNSVFYLSDELLNENS